MSISRAFHITLFALIVSAPTIALAQPEQGYTLLAPFGNILGGNNESITIQQYLSGMFRILIGTAGILAVIMIVVCGVKYMGSGDNSGARTEARDCIKNALFGVLIAIAAWLLLNTINPILLVNDLTVMATPGSGETKDKPSTVIEPEPVTPAGQYYFMYKDEEGNTRLGGPVKGEDECIILRDTSADVYGLQIIKPDAGCIRIDPKSYRPPARDGTGGTGTGGSTYGGEAATRQAVCGNTSCICKDVACTNQDPVGINKSPCNDLNVKQRGCTSVESLPQNIIQAFRALAGACGCKVVITGGTEAGHKTHRAGAPIADLRYDSASPSVNIIKSQTPDVKVTEAGNNTTRRQIGYPSFDGNRRWKYGGFWYTDEVSAQYQGGTRHWHVCQDGLPDASKSGIKYCQNPPVCDDGKTNTPPYCVPENQMPLVG